MTTDDASTAAVEPEIEVLRRKVARLQGTLERMEEYQQQNASLLRAAMAELEEERQKSDRLLLNILPQPIIERLNSSESDIAGRFDDVTVVFSDLVGFTHVSARTPPKQLVAALNKIFSEFDTLTQELGVEKIKTIGDAYLAVSGLPKEKPNHASLGADLALGMVQRFSEVTPDLGVGLGIRVGIHSGAVMAGIVGTHKYVYDVWGDTVNMASRLQNNARPGTILVSEAVARMIRFDYELEDIGEIDLKGKGVVPAFVLSGRRRTRP